MSNYLIPGLFAVFSWWSTTALILFLNHLPKRSYRWSLVASTILMITCLYGLHLSAADTTTTGAFIAFVQALAVWAWLELTYFMGAITGPSREPCPPLATGFHRFRLGLATSLYHELAVIILGVIAICLTWNMPNQFGTLTFLILWVMRWSAKLNLFLGVPNINKEWFPSHLQYLATYMKQRAVSSLFPLSVALSAIAVVALATEASNAADGFGRSGFTLVSVLVALALLEHLFMALPMRDTALWNWAKRVADKHAGH